MPRIRAVYEVEGRKVARSFARILTRATWLTPNMVTLTGTALNLVAAVILYQRWYMVAAFVFLIGSLLDAMDGAVAKITGQISAFGAFLDSTLDRVSEGFVIGGLGLLFSKEHDSWALAACFVAMGCSILTSYTRARAEALGITAKGGLASRVERVTLITAGLFFAQFWPVIIKFVVYVLAVTATVTVVQRMAHVKRELDGGRKPRHRRPTPTSRPPRTVTPQETTTHGE